MSSHRSLPRYCAVLAVVLTFTACAAVAPRKVATKPYEDLEYPGFFDIGAGAAFVFNTRDGHDDDAGGLLLSLKAYPFGRWYSTQKKKPEDRAAKAAAEAAKEAEAKAGVAPAPAGAAGAAGSATHDAVVKAIREFELEKPGELFVVKERSEFHNRMSVVYGITLEEFEGGGIDDTVQVFGLGYDVTPELAIIGGIAFYQGASGSDYDSSQFLGVSLNLFAFRSLLSANAE